MEEKPLKSVHITNYYHKTSGGISTAYNRLLEAANRRRRFVRLIVPGEYSEVEEIGGYGRIYYVKASKSPLFDKRYSVMLPWKTYIFDNAPIKKILREEVPDIIEIGEKYSLSLMAGLIRRGILPSVGRPLLVHFTCERSDDNIRAFVSDGRVARWLSRRLMGNYVFPMFDFHIANSDYTAQELFDSISPAQNPNRSDRFFNFCWRSFRAPKVPVRERVFVNLCGADIDLFSPDRGNETKRREIMTDAGFPENASVLLYAGRISPEKNIKLLPQVLDSLLKFCNDEARQREFCLLVAGDGPQADWLRQRLEEVAPGKCKMLGHVSDREKLANIYANSDIFLHPNPREPFGIAPLEAMASGLPVIAPNSGGILSYATSENAWLENPEADDYFAAIRDVLNDDRKRVVKTQNALHTARQFSWQHSTDRLFGLFDRMHEDFSKRRELYAYKAAPKKLNFISQFFGDLNKLSPFGILLTWRCCQTRIGALVCLLYFFSLAASVAFIWGRRMLAVSGSLNSEI